MQYFFNNQGQINSFKNWVDFRRHLKDLTLRSARIVLILLKLNEEKKLKEFSRIGKNDLKININEQLVIYLNFNKN